MYLQHWHSWCHVKLLQSRRVLCTPYNHASRHFVQSHTRKVNVCLTVICHLYFWQNDGTFWHNDRDILRATAVTRGWNGYRNKSQHRKLTLEKQTLPPLLQGFEPATFQSRVRRSDHWAIPAHGEVPTNSTVANNNDYKWHKMGEGGRGYEKCSHHML